MGMLYLFQFTIEYRGLSQPELFRIWVKEVEAFMKTAEGGEPVVKQVWKIVGERKVNAILEVETPEQADALSIDLPMMKEFGDQVHIEVTPMICYETFANDLNKRLNINETYTPTDPVIGEGIFYWLRFRVSYGGMTEEEFLKTWADEAAAAIKGKKAGTIVDLWKSVAKREVHVLTCVKSPEELDNISFKLPIMKKMGDRIMIECKSLRSYHGFCEDMKKRLSESDLSSK